MIPHELRDLILAVDRLTAAIESIQRIGGWKVYREPIE
jgi:hypothetical protein